MELTLTSLMPGTREGNIKQFYTHSKMTDEILFENDEAKTSFCGIILLLSNIYFEKSDPIRKKIQGDFWVKLIVLWKCVRKSLIMVLMTVLMMVL